MAEVLRNGRLPDDFFGALSARFLVTDTDGEALTAELCRGGGIHAFLGRLTAEAASVPGLAGLTLLGVDHDGEAHVLHSFFSILVGLYDLDRRLFGCCGELPPEGIPAITEIPVDNHIVHLERVLPSI